MFTPCAIAIVDTRNCPLLIRTILDDTDKEQAIKMIYLLHASLDIVDEKPTSRDNFLGTLHQSEQYKIYCFMSTTKIKILMMLSLKNYGHMPREDDIRQMLKNIHRAYVNATAMNPFHKPNEPIKSKRLDSYLDTIFHPNQTATNVPQPPAPPSMVPPVGQINVGNVTSAPAPSSGGTPTMHTV